MENSNIKKSLLLMDSSDSYIEDSNMYYDNGFRSFASPTSKMSESFVQEILRKAPQRLGENER